MPQLIELIIVSPTSMGTLVHSVLFRYEFLYSTFRDFGAILSVCGFSVKDPVELVHIYLILD